MLIKLAPRHVPSTPGLVELLLECHERIRRFVSLASATAKAEGVPAVEIVDACAQVERYFSEALPLHVADEEDSLWPRLRGVSPAVDAALQTMHDQHVAHAPGLAALMAALAAVRAAPLEPAVRPALAAAAAALTSEFTEHLTLEEGILFPALGGLPAVTQAEILGELRARRDARL